jgi:arylsulfatase
MLGSRSIFHQGWKATTNHISSGVLDEEELAIGSRRFDEDRWELFNLAEDFSEAVDRADDEPARLRALTELWTTEAERNQVLPVSDGMLDRFAGMIHAAWPPGPSQTYHPGGGPVHDESVPLLWGGFRITAEIDATGAQTGGVVCAMGDRFGGYALYVVEGVPTFTFARAADALHVSGDAPLEAGRRTLAVNYTIDRDTADGWMEFFVDDRLTDSIEVTGMLPLALQHGGAGLRLGYDSGFAVSSRYTPPATFSGVVHFVRIETPGAATPRPADEVRAALHAD